MKITDWKVTSCYSFILGDKPEWEAQLNCYKYLYEQYGFTISKLQIVAILRDWSQTRAARESDYPQSGIHVMNIPIWSKEVAEAYMRRRVKRHQTVRDCADNELPGCTSEERWTRPDSWAVMKDGNKKASRVFPLSIEAHHYISTQDKKHRYSVIERPGESVRCERFCKALPWCNQGKALGITAKVGEEQ